MFPKIHYDSINILSVGSVLKCAFDTQTTEDLEERRFRIWNVRLESFQETELVLKL